MKKQITWGKLTLNIERDTFWQAFVEGRKWYFDEAGDVPRTFTDRRLLSIISQPGKDGHFELSSSSDEHTNDAIEEAIGALVGYLSAPLLPETKEEYQTRIADCITIEA